MGHYRGRDARKARARRRKKHEARIRARAEVWVALAAFVRYSTALKEAWAAVAEGARQMGEAMRQFTESAVIFAQEQQDRSAPEEPISLPELRRQLGGDGADLERRAFTREGGIREP